MRTESRACRSFGVMQTICLFATKLSQIGIVQALLITFKLEMHTIGGLICCILSTYPPLIVQFPMI